MSDAMGMAAPPPSINSTAVNSHSQHHMMMHMTFFWGKNAEVLFSGWPGYNNMGMYVLALLFVFLLAFFVEWISHTNYIKESANHVASGLIQTALYGVRIGLAYLVMLAVMSFNAGIFLVAIAGHTLGFLVFGSRVFKKSPLMAYAKASDLPPISCNC
ncbi:PREDICTED: copper transporter 6-like [Nicotiana attenuata]|uniref:Copper transport protein n=1 Tax=Nicotiana attenuata TaxID=49451 RepID=A0A314L0Y8_NICAT|nr:PREDICTED: copper transporter 6-like [Nicotiana attenuata]OIT34709.1 copper transporter 1 [Nicotiana attenuata]